jgi:hypothetical protein
VEGRLAALLHGEDDHRLLGPDDFLQAPGAAAELAGLPADSVGAVGRADLASELHFADGREGLEILHAASHVDLPWLRVGTEGGKGHELQTVYWRSANGRSVVLRLYDKGIETGDAGPGEWLRMERQRRYRKDREMTAANVLAGGLRSAFVGRELAAITVAGTSITVCDPLEAVEQIREAAAKGHVGPRLARSLAGFVMLGSQHVPPRTTRRWCRHLRLLGIALAPNEAVRSVVPLGAYFNDFAEAWAA